jgi:hypothetical protein
MVALDLGLKSGDFLPCMATSGDVALAVPEVGRMTVGSRECFAILLPRLGDWLGLSHTVGLAGLGWLGLH